MEDLRQITVDTYNNSAEALAEYFRGIGPREKYIDMAFMGAGNPVDPVVLEIGCGDGRDAKAITTRTSNYTGMDPSAGMIQLAREHVPAGHFEVADPGGYEYPAPLDIVIAFASLLHINKSELQTVFGAIARVHRPGGTFYISTKYSPEYTEEIKEDQFGRRMFYYYTDELLAQLASPYYDVVQHWHETHGSTEWIEMMLARNETRQPKI